MSTANDDDDDDDKQTNLISAEGIGAHLVQLESETKSGAGGFIYARTQTWLESKDARELGAINSSGGGGDDDDDKLVAAR